MLQDNHYYPFGLNHNDPRRSTGGVGVNLYQYNGKELVEDNGLGWNHYGARAYDAAVGRWWVVDTMTPVIKLRFIITALNVMKYFEATVEAICWLAIFASPVLLSIGLGCASLIYLESQMLCNALLVVGAIAGVLMAERVRKREGCSNFLSKLLH